MAPLEGAAMIGTMSRHESAIQSTLDPEPDQKAAIRLTTQFRSFPVMVRVPDSGQAAKAGFLPKAEIQQTTPK